jgi:GTP-binding protein LepA
VLLVDAAQGIEAQTLANLYLAMENELTVIPVLNKIDLPAAQPEKYAEELARLIGCDPQDCFRVSGKTGEGVEPLLDEIVRQFPPPVGDAQAPARAMIFDSVYDTYRGVVTYVRVIDGALTPRERIQMMSTKATHELLEIGVISPEPVPSKGLGVGEVGYLITGVKDVRQSRVGDTVTDQAKPASTPLAGYRDPKPMVFSGLYPIDGSDYPDLRDALDKLKLNDAALVYEPETSAALGFGFRCGFLGLLHLEIVRERLEREFNLDLISTQPNVVYDVTLEDAKEVHVTNPSEFPHAKVAEVREPIVRATILAPSEFIGAIMELCQQKRGSLRGMDYLSEDRVEMRYTLPLAEIVFDFFDQLKSRTRGYASLDYEPDGDQVAELVKVDILLQGETVDAFSAIVHKDKAYGYGVMMAGKLKELIPRQVLRRRHQPQAEAAREAEGGQEAHEDGGPRGGAPGSLHRGTVLGQFTGQDEEVAAAQRPRGASRGAWRAAPRPRQRTSPGPEASRPHRRTRRRALPAAAPCSPRAAAVPRSAGRGGDRRMPAAG